MTGRMPKRKFLSGLGGAAVPAHAATSVIPIVCPALADAVHLGLIASEARPGGNVTGIEPYVGGLPANQIEFAREIAPGASQIGLLTNLRDPKAPPQRQELVSAAEALKLTVAEADINSRWPSRGLTSSVDLRWCYRRGAYFVDKILRGTRPGELPVVD